LTIGISMTWGHPYWQNMITGFKDEAQAQGKKRGQKVRLVFNNAEEDASKQISQCESLVAQGVDAVVMVPVQEEASVRAVRLINDAQIPVILVNRQIKDKTGQAQWVCYTGTDTYQGAKVSAEMLMKALGGAGNVVELQQVLGSNPQVVRSQALQEVLQDYPQVKLLSQQCFGSNEATAVTIMEDLLRAHPEINGVYAHGDNAAIFALKACEAAQRKDIKIVGMGGNKDALQAIRQKRLVGTSYQQPYEEGRNGLRCAVAYLLGEKVKRYQPLPVLPVTQENASQYKGQF
jgi:ABC-type sugar transport system substrate-binding protein